MRFKITTRYLASVLMIFIIIFFANVFLLLFIISQQGLNSETPLNNSSFEQKTRDFANYFSKSNDDIILSKEGQEQLAAMDAWIQMLDENGKVITSFSAPKDAPTHYRPIELIHNYKYMDDDLNLYFIGEFGQYSYLLITPKGHENRFIFVINSQEFLTTISKFILIAFIINLLIVALVGFIFSRFFTRPINHIIERINALKNRTFTRETIKKPGIYHSVFTNINDVATTLKEHEAEQEKLVTMRQEWVSNVSHDIKTPLSSIRGYAELLQDEQVTNEERINYAAIIERQSLYIRELLDDFNLAMNLRDEKLNLQLEETNIEHFLREIIIDLLNDAQFPHAQINYEAETETLFWEIDRHLFKRALLNFIYNALIHNENVQVTVKVTNNSVIISDDGKGIPENEQEKVFSRYYRGTNTGEIHGTGLGMAISHDIIAAHGGNVSLRSSIDEGTEITLKIEGPLSLP